MGFSWSFLLLLLVVLVLGFDGVVKCNGGTSSAFIRAVQPSVDMPLTSRAFRFPHGYNAPQQVSFFSFPPDQARLVSCLVYLLNNEILSKKMYRKRVLKWLGK